MDLIFLDTETTGNDLVKDRLCQICYKIGDEFRVGFFKPPIPMTVKSMSITHITNRQLADKEAFGESKFREELQRKLDNGVLVAHNAKFDIAMLKSEGMIIPKHICTLRVARFLDSENKIPEYNLQFLRYFLDLDIDAFAHDAEGDVRVLSAVFDRLLLKIKEKFSDADPISKMIEISGKPTIFSNFNFGKHKDKKIKDVVKTDRGYLEWLLKQKLDDGADDEDWIFTLKHFLGV